MSPVVVGTGRRLFDEPDLHKKLRLADATPYLRFSLGPTAQRITYRFTKDGRIILLATFRKQRNKERTEIARARRAAENCAERNP